MQQKTYIYGKFKISIPPMDQLTATICRKLIKISTLLQEFDQLLSIAIMTQTKTLPFTTHHQTKTSQAAPNFPSYSKICRMMFGLKLGLVLTKTGQHFYKT